ncbi:hypothetical protein J5I95_08815 [Candidatus Poribacteria bacterium]|nr:hypothetical protein [Candidatus Poribacteria bacterium]
MPLGAKKSLCSSGEGRIIVKEILGIYAVGCQEVSLLQRSNISIEKRAEATALQRSAM